MNSIQNVRALQECNPHQADDYTRSVSRAAKPGGPCLRFFAFFHNQF